MLNYSIRDFEGIKILELSGNLTSKTVDVFRQVVERIVERESIMINLENLNLITSAGLNTLIDLSFYAKSMEKRIIFLWPNEELQKMVDTMEVYNYLIFSESLEEGQTKINLYT